MKIKDKNKLLKQVGEAEKFFHEVTKDKPIRLTAYEIICGFEDMEKLAKCLREVIGNIETERESNRTKGE